MIRSNGTRRAYAPTWTRVWVEECMFFINRHVYIRCRCRLALRIFRDRRTLIMCRAFLIRISLLWGKAKKKGGRRQQDKSTYPRTGIIFFVSVLLRFIVFAFTVLESCFENASCLTANSHVDRLSRVVYHKSGQDKRTYNAYRVKD